MVDINDEDLDLLDLFCDDEPTQPSSKPPPRDARDQPQQQVRFSCSNATENPVAGNQQRVRASLVGMQSLQLVIAC